MPEASPAAEPSPRLRLEQAGLALWGNRWKRAAARFLGMGWWDFRQWGRGDCQPPEWAVERLEFERARRREIVLKGE